MTKKEKFYVVCDVDFEMDFDGNYVGDECYTPIVITQDSAVLDIDRKVSDVKVFEVEHLDTAEEVIQYFKDMRKPFIEEYGV